MPGLSRTDRLRTLFPQIFYRSPVPATLTLLEDGRYIEVNDAWVAMFGHSREETVGRTRKDLNIWVDEAQSLRLGEMIRAQGSVSGFETSARKRSGEICDVVLSSEVVDYGAERCLLVVVHDISERKRIERQLRQSEERFATIFEASPLPMTLTRLDDGRYLMANRATEMLTGYSREELIGRTSTEIGIWAGENDRHNIVSAIRAGAPVSRTEARVRTKDGRVVDVVFAVASITIDGVAMLHGTVLDLSHLNEALRRQSLSEQRFEKVFQVGPHAIVFSRASDGGNIQVNQAWHDMFGHTRDDIQGQTSNSLNLWVEPDFRERRRQLMASGQLARNLETRMRTKSGSILDVTMSSDHVDLDGEQYVITSVTDITERKRAERERTRIEERFAKVFRASPIAIVIVSLEDGRYVEVNDAWQAQFGHRREDVIGKLALDLGIWVDPAERRDFVAFMRQSGSGRNFEARLRRRSGEVVNVLLSAEHIDLEGEPSLVVCVEDVTERKRAERHIEHLATRDHLTGLPNRVLFGDRLHHALAKSERDGTRVALMFIDLDRFKDINDSMGHHTGDRLLIEVAGRLCTVMRNSDSVARQGGDEFLVLIEGLAAGRDVEPVARKLVDFLAEPFRIDDRLHSVSSSVGVAIFPDDARTAEDLMRNADLAMYSVKETGRNGFRFFSADMNQRLQARVETEGGLRGALERDELELYYQPKIDLASGRVTGCEALLRWNHPVEGVLLPERFIGIAEETRLIVPIGEWVIRRACADLRAWQARGGMVVPVAVNLSVHQFDSALPELVAGILRDAGIAPGLIEAEITETVMMQDTVAHLNIMRSLKQVGIRIAIDDFGTGYSSLSYLRQMEIDSLKIDASFVRNLTTNAGDRTIVAAIIALAGQFGMNTVAEGVETQAQYELLQQMHCRECQGFLFSRALPAAQFAERYLPGAR